MFVGFACLSGHIIHCLESLGPEEYLAALDADLSRHISENVQMAFPVMNVFNSPLFHRAFAMQAFLHVWRVQQPAFAILSGAKYLVAAL